MRVEYDWRAEGGEEAGETIARTPARRARWVRVLRKVWRAVRLALVAAVAIAAAGYGVMRVRYAQLERRAEREILQVMAVEQRALARGDARTFLAQQDEEARAWTAYQERWFLTRPTTVGRREAEAERGEIRIEGVELHGDVAWVWVVEGEARRARFYRHVAADALGGAGWKQTAPQPEFWGEAREVQRGELIVRYRERDAPFVRALLPVLERVASAAAADLRYCLAGRKVIVSLTPDVGAAGGATGGLPPGAQSYRREMSLLSPWVTGMPADGVWDGAWLEPLSYEVAHVLAETAMRSATQPELTALQAAMADEYAVWLTQGRNRALAPLLGRVLERNGEEKLPVVFLSLKGARLSSLFLVQWLGVYPADEDGTFFEMALDLEREALVTGREETFLMFQAPEAREAAAAWYEARRAAGGPPPPRARVAQVEFVGEMARVMVEGPDGEAEEEWWDWMRMRRAGGGGN